MAFSSGLPKTLVVIFMLALMLRILFVVIHQRPLFSDQREYDSLAFTLSESGEYQKNGEPTAYRPVGYPMFLAVSYKLFGHRPLISLLLQAVIDTLTGLLLYFTALPKGQRVALTAASFWLVYPPAILYSALLLSEAITAFLLVLTAFLFRCVLESSKSWFPVALGLSLGTLSLIKPWMAFFAILVIGVTLLSGTSFRKIAVAIGAFLLVILPWMIRNSITMGTMTLSTNSGMNLYIGNNPSATGGYRSISSESFQEEDEVLLNKKAFGAGLHYMVENPGTFFVLGLKKLAHLFRSEGEVLVWSFASSPWDSAIPFSEKYRSLPISLVTIVNGGYIILLLTGLFGLFLSDNDIILRYFVIFFLLTILVHFVFFGGSRFHFPLMPFFALYSGEAVTMRKNDLQRLVLWKKAALSSFIFLLIVLWTYEFTVTF
ncbi:MAG: glycosyltransferase family 39 protein [Ignavibacteriales bacterium]|nr:glycosyltransferase family 39 protein [Ignavibacteriales bacterium]